MERGEVFQVLREWMRSRARDRSGVGQLAQSAVEIAFLHLSTGTTSHQVLHLAWVATTIFGSPHTTSHLLSIFLMHAESVEALVQQLYESRFDDSKRQPLLFAIAWLHRTSATAPVPLLHSPSALNEEQVSLRPAETLMLYLLEERQQQGDPFVLQKEWEIALLHGGFSIALQLLDIVEGKDHALLLELLSFLNQV